MGFHAKRRLLLPLAVLTVLAGCMAGQSVPEGDAAPRDGGSQADGGRESAVSPSALSWKCDGVVRTLEMPMYYADGKNRPEGAELPEEILGFFTAEYGEQFAPDDIYPLMGYEIDTFDFNGDGREDYAVRGYPKMGGQMLPDAYLFLTGEEGFRRVLVPQPFAKSLRVLGGATNGLPDLLYGIGGSRLAYDGQGSYAAAPDDRPGLVPPGSLLVSEPQADGREVWIPAFFKGAQPESGCVAAYFKSDAADLESPYAWFSLKGEEFPAEFPLVSDGREYGLRVRLREGVALPEGAYLMPDEIQCVPAGPGASG